MTLLLTGFEPFGGSDSNSSEQVARALDGQNVAGLYVQSAILPVDRQRGPDALLAAIALHHPAAVVCLGEAANRAVVSLERVAINLLDYRIADNAGNLVVDQPVVTGGPAAYFASLPLRAMQSAMLAVGVPVELSLSAGSFLCNQVMYQLLHQLAQHTPRVPAGFIHLPGLPEQAARAGKGAPSMSVETSLRAVRAALCTLTPPEAGTPA
jgi:pyroglutamyl-peptidase